MLSNQILHKTAQDIREITGFDCAIWDMQGFCLVRTNETLTGYEIQIQDFRDDEEEPEEMILDEMGMFRIYEDSDPVYVLMLHGNADGMELAGRMGASQLRNLLYVYKERMDKNRFIQNLLLDNLLLVDIYNQAKKMKIPAELKRVVFVIEPKNEGDVLVQETLKGLYATGTKDFVTAIDGKTYYSCEVTAVYRQLSAGRTDRQRAGHDAEYGSHGKCKSGIWNNCRRIKGCIQIIQRSRYGFGSRKSVLYREEDSCIQ